MFAWKYQAIHYFGFVVDEFSKVEHTIKSLDFRHKKIFEVRLDCTLNSFPAIFNRTCNITFKDSSCHTTIATTSMASVRVVPLRKK